MMSSLHKKRGRPPGNKELRLLRCNTWLLAVQSRCGGRNNCQLDVHFGPEDEQREWNPASRLKMFEAVKNGSIPSKGARTNRGFDLILKVDAEPGYESTAAIINSPFWDLIDNKQLSLSEIREMVITCISNLDLAIKAGTYIDDGSNDLEEDVSSNPNLTIEDYFARRKWADVGYDQAMFKAFKGIEPSLDFIALAGALAVEAIYAGNMMIASYQVDIFKIFMQKFCEQPWMANEYKKKSNCLIGNDLYQYAKKRILEILNEDALNGLPDYLSLLASNIPGANSNSAIAALLVRHQRMLWRK